MTPVSKVCRKCGTEIPADAPEGGCPGCLLETALDAAGGQIVFGRFKLVKVLGRGGMGIVWLARDEELERQVALKFLPDLMIQDRSLLDQLKRETKRSLELTHPHIVRIHDFVHDQRSGCISMEYVDGETLSNFRAEKQQKVFETHEIAGWISQLCDALHYAHNQARISHRDLKPANLMVNQRGDLKVTDFGIARSLADSATRLTAEQGRSGTLVYMSPQQLNGERSTHLDDIYSLGATIYELLTSKPPFYSGNIDRQICERAAPSMTQRRKEFNIEPASVPKVWEDAVAVCLAKDPSRRPQSAVDVAQRLQLPSAQARLSTSSSAISKKKSLLFAGIAALAVLALGGSYVGGMLKRQAKSSPQVAAAPEKSIAVLPFENLSADQENAFFADGVQDEILTDLAKVADLKVISRRSVMQYRSDSRRNLRQIAAELGVANVLEGTVQRAGGHVKISAQLIDARTDTHIWATTFDRPLADVFAVQSDVAVNIVTQLKAKLSSAEKMAINRKPTDDLMAYDRFARAKILIESTVLSGREKENLFESLRLLEEAVARDPTFLRAFCQLARVHDKIYILGLDHSSARLEMADEAIKRATGINPDAGEVHLAKANHFYSYRNYDLARQELVIATSLLPNEPLCFELAGFMARRSGDWEDSVRQLLKALELDPRDVYLLQQLSITYEHMRNFPEMVRTLERAIQIAPDDVTNRVQRGIAYLEWRADPKPLHATIGKAMAQDPSIVVEIAQDWLYLALCERDWNAAERAMTASNGDACQIENVVFPRNWCHGLLARARGDTAGAREAFSMARAESEKIIREQPDFGEALCALGMIEAALGDKDKAVEHGKRAVQLVPVTEDAINGPLLIEYLSIIYSWTGRKDLAIEELKRAATIPSTINYGMLRLHPYWDELRGDPRFEQIVASLAPN